MTIYKRFVGNEQISTAHDLLIACYVANERVLKRSPSRLSLKLYEGDEHGTCVQLDVASYESKRLRGSIFVESFEADVQRAALSAPTGSKPGRKRSNLKLEFLSGYTRSLEISITLMLANS